VQDSKRLNFGQNIEKYLRREMSYYILVNEEVVIA
jgi:hypothetical protein